MYQAYSSLHISFQTVISKWCHACSVTLFKVLRKWPYRNIKRPSFCLTVRVTIFSGIITFHCCLVTYGTCALGQIIETMCFRLMVDCKLLLCFLNKPCEISRHGGSGITLKMLKLSPPERFDFSKPLDWPDWKQNFLRLKLHKEDGYVQVSALVYTMGREAEHVYKSFTLAEEDEKKFDGILAKFDEHFVPKRNVIHERALFHLRNQRQGETVESLVRSLYEIAEHCDFTTSRDQEIRDSIVIGSLDKNVFQKLQLKADLTSEAAI